MNASVSDAAADTVIVPDDLLRLLRPVRAPAVAPASRRPAITIATAANLVRSLHARSRLLHHLGRPWHFHDDVRRLHDRDREIARLDAELVGGLAGHQRRHPVRAGLEVHHRDESVLLRPA